MACHSACNSWEWETDPSLFDSSQWCGTAGLRKPTADATIRAVEAASGHGNSELERYASAASPHPRSLPCQRKLRIDAVGHDDPVNDSDAMASLCDPRLSATSTGLLISASRPDTDQRFAKNEDAAANGLEIEGFYENQRREKRGKGGFLDLSRTENECSDGIVTEKERLAVGGCKGEHDNVAASHGVVKTEETSANTRHSASSADSLTGLQLGKRTYTQSCGEEACAKPSQRMKKSRSGAKTPRCQVQGCDLDLTAAKEYHRRHKVCEAHSKAVKVVVSSLEQRFCQQCSRFHPLAEFDDAKRSCRRRLAGHNERRRKPQPDPLAIQARLSPLEGWPYLHQDKFSRASLFPSYGDFRWPRQGDQLNYDYNNSNMSLPMAMGRQMYTRGLPLLTNEALPLRSSTSPLVPPIAMNAHSHITPTSMISNSLTLATTASMPLADQGDTFPGFGMTPLSCSIDRVPEYGRALSLLSLQTRSSPAPSTVSPEPWCLSDTVTTDHHHHHHSSEAVAPQHWLLQSQDHQASHVFSVENMMQQYMTSKAQQSHGNSAGYEEDEALRSPPVHEYENRLQGSSKHSSNLESSSSKSILTTMPYLWNDGSSSGRAA